MPATPVVIRTKKFVTDAANFIVDLAHKALAERNEFRIALHEQTKTLLVPLRTLSELIRPSLSGRG